MSIEDLYIFDAWEPMEKARKPIGLKNWSRLTHIADKLEGKQVKHITFTTAYPGHEGKKKTLGSIEGNLHFLLGYGNPAFYMMPYHWQIIDPNLTDEEALEIHKLRGHPSKPELWDKAELGDVGDEGDVEEGEPHPTIAEKHDEQIRQKLRAEGNITVRAGAGTYVAIPSEGLVYGKHNNHVYKWDMIKDSFLAAAHPELSEKMNEAARELTELRTSVKKSHSIPETVLYPARKEQRFSDDVYSLVKSYFPSPGSVVPISVSTDETVYGVVTESSLDFYDRDGSPVEVAVYDRTYKSFDLTRDGNIHPSVLYSFGAAYLGLDRDSLEQFVSDNTVEATSTVVKGQATPGFDEVDEHDFEKSVEVIGDTFRLVPRKIDE